MPLSDRIAWSLVDGGVIVLDTCAGSFHALDAPTTARWCALLDGHDDAELMGALARRGWTLPAPAPPLTPAVRTRQPLVRAMKCLRIARRLVDNHGLAAGLAWVARSEAGGRSRRLSACSSAFLAAETLLMDRRYDDDCLPRSIALAAALRGSGHPVEHVIGVRRFPFRAHAWVELDGTPLLESDDFAPSLRGRGGFRRLLVT